MKNSLTGKHLFFIAGIGLLTNALFPFSALAQENMSSPRPSGNLSADIESKLSSTALRDTGGRIVFTLIVEKRRHIFQVEPENGKVSRLITEPGENYAPSFSPDGNALAFVSTRSGAPQIWITDPAMEEFSQLTKTKGEKSHLEWAPDGKSIVFTSTKDTGGDQTSNIARVDLATGKVSKVTNFKGRSTTPTISKEKRIAYSTNRFWPGWDICTKPLKSGSETCLLTGNNSFTYPSYSDDSSTLAFVRNNGQTSDLGLMSTANSDVRFLSMKSKIAEPEWSPDQSSILLREQIDGGEKFALAVVDKELAGTRQLLISPYPIKHISWNATTMADLEIAKVINKLSVIKPLKDKTPPTDYKAPYLAS